MRVSNYAKFRGSIHGNDLAEFGIIGLYIIRKTDFTVADYGHTQVSLIIMPPHRRITCTCIGIDDQSYVDGNTPEPRKILLENEMVVLCIVIHWVIFFTLFQRYTSVIALQSWKLYCFFFSSSSTSKLRVIGPLSRDAQVTDIWWQIYITVTKGQQWGRRWYALTERGASLHDLNPKLPPSPSD